MGEQRVNISREELKGLIKDVVQETVKQAVEETFLRMGLAANDPLEAQKDFQHLRSWRKSTESLGAKALATAVGIMVTGGIAALWVGLSSKFHT